VRSYLTGEFLTPVDLSAEAMGHVEILGWDNAQISLSLADLENLLREEESNSASS
jgi:hypothetical protein